MKKKMAKVANFINKSKGFYSIKPPLTTCTGRSYGQSVGWILEPLGIVKENIPQDMLESWPPFMFENGSVLYHVHSGRVENLLESSSPDYVECVISLKQKFMERFDELNPFFDGEVARVPPKRNMFTVDVPHNHRGTQRGEEFSEEVLRIAGEICNDLGVALVEK